MQLLNRNLITLVMRGCQIKINNDEEEHCRNIKKILSSFKEEINKNKNSSLQKE